MIEVDISNIWGQVSLPNLLAIEKEVFDAHAMLTREDAPGAEYRGWMKLPLREPTQELERLLAYAKKIRSASRICIVVGIGGSSLGARAAIELLLGPDHNIGKPKGSPRILFAGDSFSTRRWNELTRLLEGKDFSLIVISKSGATLESAVAFRSLRWLLERRYGTEESARRIYAVTDPCSGALHQLAQENGWETFSIPPAVTGNFSILSPAGLLPMAVAGIDILRLLQGAAEGMEHYELRSFENPVWLYAAVRTLLYRKGKTVELMTGQEPGFSAFGRWWQQLFANAEGKNGKGLFPAWAEFPGDLHVLGQLIQQGTPSLFETMVRFRCCDTQYTIGSDVKDTEGLNYLAGMTLDQVDDIAYQSALEAHADAGVSVISMTCGELREQTLGELIWFLELSCILSAQLLGVDPYFQTGLEPYRQNLFHLLGRPGF